MTELEIERETLVKADRDIVEGEERVTRQLALIARLRAGGHSVIEAETLLDTLLETLQAWQEHRILIIHTINRLESNPG